MGVGSCQGFFKAPGQQGESARTKQGQHEDCKAPAQPVGQQPAQRCAGASDDAQTGQALRHHVGPLRRCIQISNHRACGHDARAHGDALHGAARNQPGHVGGKGAGHRGEGVGGHAPQQNGPSAKPVRQRAPHQLRQAKRQQQGRQGELGLAHAGPKAFGDGGQGGQVQVGGDRLQAEQQGQDENDQFGGHARHHRPRKNSASRSRMLICRQVGRPWLHWSERSVSSIWRSKAFISSSVRRRLARTAP